MKRKQPKNKMQIPFHFITAEESKARLRLQTIAILTVLMQSKKDSGSKEKPPATVEELVNESKKILQELDEKDYIQQKLLEEKLSKAEANTLFNELQMSNELDSSDLLLELLELNLAPSVDDEPEEEEG